MKDFIRWFNCVIMGSHEWTCKANEGISPTKQELLSSSGFKSYTKMYCKHCKFESRLNNRL